MVKNRFSLESITSSIYGNGNLKSRSSEAATAFAKNGVMPILFENNDSIGYYAIAAQESLQEGKQLSMYADLALESLSSNVKIIRRLKSHSRLKSRGIEGKMSLESVDASAVIRKVIFAIKTALEKFITAIGNFIKSVANFIGSQLVKNQEKTFIAAREIGIKKLATDPKISDEKISIVVPTLNFANISSLDNIIALMYIWPSSFLESASNLDKFVNKLPNNDAKKAARDAFANGKVPNGRTLALLNIYDTTNITPKEVKLTDCLKDEKSFMILANQYLKHMNAAVYNAKIMAATINKELKEISELERMVKNPDKNEEVKRKIRPIKYEKNLYGMFVQYILTVYGEFLKLRSQQHRILKMALSKTGNKKS